MLRQRIRPEVAGPMTGAGGASSILGIRSYRAFNDYWIIRLRG